MQLTGFITFAVKDKNDSATFLGAAISFHYTCIDHARKQSEVTLFFDFKNSIKKLFLVDKISIQYKINKFSTAENHF